MDLVYSFSLLDYHINGFSAEKEDWENISTSYMKFKKISYNIHKISYKREVLQEAENSGCLFLHEISYSFLCHITNNSLVKTPPYRNEMSIWIYLVVHQHDSTETIYTEKFISKNFWWMFFLRCLVRLSGDISDDKIVFLFQRKLWAPKNKSI